MLSRQVGGIGDFMAENNTGDHINHGLNNCGLVVLLAYNILEYFVSVVSVCGWFRSSRMARLVHCSLGKS